MFSESAAWYDRFYGTKDYAGEAQLVSALIRRHQPRARTLLDVACGTGRHLEHLRREFDCQGLDLDAGLLKVAAERLPGTRLTRADMTDFALGRRFDAVICLFSSIGYLATVERLRTAVATMAGHLEPGGVLVVEPWILPEAWIEGRAPDVEVVEDGERKLVRVIATSRQDAASVLRIHYAVAAAGEIQTADERHQLRLFTHEWLDDSRLSGGQLSADAQQLQNGRPAGSGPIGCRSHSVGHSATHDTARRGSISWMAHPTLDVVSLPLAG